MGVEGGGGEGGGERKEEEEQGLPGQQEQHGTPGGVIDRLVGHMTVPRLPVLVEAGSTTANTTTNNNSDITSAFNSKLIRLLGSSQVGIGKDCWLCWAILQALAGEGKALDGSRGGWLEA